MVGCRRKMGALVKKVRSGNHVGVGLGANIKLKFSRICSLIAAHVF